MYQRCYTQNEGIPPNYKGNAFDTAEEQLNNEKEQEPRDCSNCSGCTKCAPDQCSNNQQENMPKCKEEKGILGSLLSRRDGSSFALDDIILGGLIVLLLNSHADDELLLVLVLLFISGI